jgi:hypothetical protein
MKPYLPLIDTSTLGPRCDVTPLFADREALSQLAGDLAKPFLGLDIDAVAHLVEGVPGREFRGHNTELIWWSAWQSAFAVSLPRKPSEAPS